MEQKRRSNLMHWGTYTYLSDVFSTEREIFYISGGKSQRDLAYKAQMEFFLRRTSLAHSHVAAYIIYYLTERVIQRAVLISSAALKRA